MKLSHWERAFSVLRCSCGLADDLEADFRFDGAAEHLHLKIGEALVAIDLLDPTHMIHERAARDLYLIAFDDALGDVHHTMVGLGERVEPSDLTVAQGDERFIVAEDPREGRHAAERLLKILHPIGYDYQIPWEQRARADDPFAANALLRLIPRDEALLEDATVAAHIALAHADILADEPERSLFLPRCHLRDIPHGFSCLFPSLLLHRTDNDLVTHYTVRILWREMSIKPILSPPVA